MLHLDKTVSVSNELNGRMHNYFCTGVYYGWPIFACGARGCTTDQHINFFCYYYLSSSLCACITINLKAVFAFVYNNYLSLWL